MHQSAPFQHVRFFLHRISQEWCRVEPGILPVPFLAHTPDQAASAALSMVMCYYGFQSPDQGVTGDLHASPGGEWDLARQMATTARTCGLDAATTVGNLTRLTEWLQQGVPVVVFPESDIRGAGEAVAIVTGLTHDRTAVCLHYGSSANLWLRLPDFLALCGGAAFPAVPVAERHQATHARTRQRARRPGQQAESCLNLWPDPVSAMAA